MKGLKGVSKYMTYRFFGIDKRYSAMIDCYSNPTGNIESKVLRRAIVVLDMAAGEKVFEKHVRRAPISFPHDIDPYVNRIFRRDVAEVKAARQAHSASKSILEHSMV